MAQCSAMAKLLDLGGLDILAMDDDEDDEDEDDEDDDDDDDDEDDEDDEDEDDEDDDDDDDDDEEEEEEFFPPFKFGSPKPPASVWPGCNQGCVARCTVIHGLSHWAVELLRHKKGCCQHHVAYLGWFLGDAFGR